MANACGLLLVIFFLLKLSETVEFLKPGECGMNVSKRILGGTVADIDSYPWTVLIYYRDKDGMVKPLCGGSLVSDRHILTAAHCTNKNLTSVRLGEWDLQSEVDCNSERICSDPPLNVGIKKIIAHENYNPNQFSNDIALIELDKSIMFTKCIAPICMPFTNIAMQQNTDRLTFIATGWGATEETDKSRYKLQVLLKGVNQTYCDAVQIHPISSKQICAGGEKLKDTCKGDSGGGLVANVDSYYYVYGIVSWGKGCGKLGKPGVYTRVTSYLTWIKQNMI